MAKSVVTKNGVVIVAHNAQADSMAEEIIRFVEMNTDGEILNIEIEVR